MKLKLFFLGLFAAAFFMSCNNEIDGGSVPNDDGVVASKGIPTYVSFNLSPTKIPGTYAGTSPDQGFSYEKKLSGDAAVFVYKWDGTNANPEAFAYLASGGIADQATDNVILKATDGTKKIFVALNIGGPASGSGGTFFDDAVVDDETLADEGAAFATSFSTLNRAIWTDGVDNWSATAPVAPFEGTANGLIRAFAGGSFTNTNGLLRGEEEATPGTLYTNAYFLLSNWDNNRRDSITGGPSYPLVPGQHANNCIVTLKPDVPKTDALAENNAHLYVQRAVAKVWLEFDPSIALAGTPWTYVSDAADSTGSKGRFIPWGASTSTGQGFWALGGLNKVSSVFQKFTTGSVSDDNYAYISPTTQTDDWYKNFDNTRIYGTGKLYGSATVMGVRDTMIKAGNSSRLGAEYQYATENAQSYPAGYRDNSTYAVVGGQYVPQFWVSKITQAKVVTNDPMIEFNNGIGGAGIPVTDSVSGGIYRGPEYAPITYTSSGSSSDTLYYHAGYNIFFYGRDNIAKYFAWVQKRGTAAENESLTPESEAGIITEINNDITAGALIQYYQGNCFYRVFITDYNAELSNERVLVRRNHIYDINITKILGPGIADPNLLITPDPVLPVETYLAVTIEIQQWHVVTQEEEVKND